MIFKILVFVGLYFFIKNILKSVFVANGPQVNNPQAKAHTQSRQDDVIDAEFKVIKEE